MILLNKYYELIKRYLNIEDFPNQEKLFKFII